MPDDVKPAWHDRPTCPGLWFYKWGIGKCAACLQELRDDSDVQSAATWGFRWYGPIPPDESVTT